MDQLLETTMARLRADVASEARSAQAERPGVVTLARALPATEESLALLEARWRFDEVTLADRG
jgi:hypothetical protein